MDIYTPKKVDNFQEAISHNPIVHELMRRAFYEDVNMVDALRQCIVMLVNENSELQHRLASEIAGKPSTLFIKLDK